MLDLAIPLGEKPGNSATFGFDLSPCGAAGITSIGYLAGVDKPFVVGLLESAGGETVVDVLELVMDSNTVWWP